MKYIVLCTQDVPLSSGLQPPILYLRDKSLRVYSWVHFERSPLDLSGIWVHKI